ncbi:hypothetical protein PUG46_00140 [Erwiniaceae bacterium L1_55_4]|nr:hypothetical protein [Erwiniaceae bacterium L1_55_4]
MEKYYVSGCKGQDDDIVTCADDEAEFWTLYQRMEDGTSQGIIDLMFREDAEVAMAAYAERDTLQQKLDAVVADQKRYDFLAQFFDVDMWDADDYHCIRGLCFNEPKFDRITMGLPHDMSLEDAIDEHLKRADATKGGSDD